MYYVPSMTLKALRKILSPLMSVLSAWFTTYCIDLYPGNRQMSRMKKARPLNVTPGKAFLILIILFLTEVAIQQGSEFFDPQTKN